MPSRCFVLLALLAASAAAADDRPVGPPAPPRDPLGKPSPPAPQAEAQSGRWSIQAGQASVYDSNIDHEADPRADYGLVFMGGAGWQNRLSKPSLTFRYEAALHRYHASPKWDRLSHQLEGAFEKRIARRWTSGTRAEISIKGSSEDRELSNQYGILQQLDFRIVRGLELRGFGLARLKRYPAPDEGRDSTNAYAGLALRARLGGARLEMASRYETNAARDEVRDYSRWVHGVELDTPLGNSDALDLGVKLYDQLYPNREVGDGPAEGNPRQDRRWVYGAAWLHRFRDDLAVELGYKYEYRASNEPGKGFVAHQAAVSFVYRFDRPRPRPADQ